MFSLAGKLFGINRLTSQYGLDLQKLSNLRFLLGDLVRFGVARRQFKNLSRTLESDVVFPMKSNFPCLDGMRQDASGGTLDRHYFVQDLYVAQRVFENKPQRHVDVGSRIDGFVAHVAAFREIECFDVRPLEIKAANIRFSTLDITDSATVPDELADSVSCLHVLEHIGLGRYGDKIDPDGWKIALRNLVQMVQTGGRLYVSVPAGRQRVEFNAHRIFSPATILESIKLDTEVLDLLLIDDYGKILNFGTDIPRLIEAAQELRYGCLVLTVEKKLHIGNTRPETE